MKKRAGRGAATRLLVTVGEAILTVIVAFGAAALVQAYLLKPYSIPSRSMVPTLVVHQRILVDRLSNRFRDPKVGDVVVFHPPANTDLCGGKAQPGQACPQSIDSRSRESFVKRIVAGPGDRIAINGGQVFRNGKAVSEPYLNNSCRSLGTGGCDYPFPLTVPPGRYFMMGDNRGESDDSRYWGAIPRSWIVGRVVASYWPPSRWGRP